MKQYKPSEVSLKVAGHTVKGCSEEEATFFEKPPDSGLKIRIIGINKATGLPQEVVLEFESSLSRQRMLDLISRSKNKRFSAKDKKQGHKIELEKIRTELF